MQTIYLQATPLANVLRDNIGVEKQLVHILKRLSHKKSKTCTERCEANASADRS